MSILRQTRMTANMSIETAAKELGISAGYLSQIELGHRHISAERAEQIAKLYKIEKDDIFLPIRYAIREVDNRTA
ncbi:helix-turn-helix domain-containing protein [Peribacillus asahii]|uniref:helix-turn-helix domain-containing protein n=1 Tax=Peribacillus asahii TaxID=228899 RepID=UPI00207A1E9C|nr:helix-turn-helix transcriptional regulator [Peribacillus asahii]USK85696.1 helix-turn-helix domain-containing protein [Peribacillus asahii]